MTETRLMNETLHMIFLDTVARKYMGLELDVVATQYDVSMSQSLCLY